MLVCAVAEALTALRERAEYEGHGDREYAFGLRREEKAGLLGLLVAFKDATGCAWTDASWA